MMHQERVDFWGTLQTGTLSNSLLSQVPLFVLSRLLSSLWVSRTGRASDWCALQEALYKCIDTIQYNAIQYNTMQYNTIHYNPQKISMPVLRFTLTGSIMSTGRRRR